MENVQCIKKMFTMYFKKLSVHLTNVQHILIKMLKLYSENVQCVSDFFKPI